MAACGTCNTVSKVTEMRVPEDVKQPGCLTYMGRKVYNACNTNVERKGKVVSSEKDLDANVVYPNKKVPYVFSVSKQEVPITCLTQHRTPIQTTI